ncbi:hypothetical protein BKA66DRAFT_477156 [Pyrenochaeta sp. MPI-SDFR-AT-0127]|nr:hypothetical protein BKA66DRAFT_477156 [Pyrenochaeta sp. MPI-SDFR-AT-0127]
MFRSARPPSPSSARYLHQNSKPRSIIRCGPITIYDPEKDFAKRFDFDITITIYSWPSRGGVIMLENASVADFSFLSLDRLNPKMLRHETREEEDAFSKQLLLLGAKWWDSLARYWLLNSPDQDIAERDNNPVPTIRERYWFGVAWPSTGGLVVSEYDTNMYGVGIETDTVPDDVCRLILCTTMDEKATMLRERFGGKLWNSVDDYDGNAFISCWGSKDSGEVGQLLQTWLET